MRSRTQRIGLAALIALLALAGCIPQMPGASQPPPVQPPLAGTSWNLEAYGAPGNLTDAIAGRDATIQFTGEELTGQASCNAYFGQYKSKPDGTLIITGLGNTEMYCAEAGVMDQEQAFLDALREATSYQVVDGTLRISGGGVLLVLSRA